MSYITASNLWRHRWAVAEKYTSVHQSQPTPTSRQQTLVIQSSTVLAFLPVEQCNYFCPEVDGLLLPSFQLEKTCYGWLRGATKCAVIPGQLNGTVKPEQKSDKGGDLDRDRLKFTLFTQPFEPYNLMQYTKANTVSNFQKTFWEGWHPFYLFTKKQGQARERAHFRPLQAIKAIAFSCLVSRDDDWTQ